MPVQSFANTSKHQIGGGYRQMVTVEGRFNTGAIVALAHHKARHEFNGFLVLEAGLLIGHCPLGDVVARTAELAATVDRSKVKSSFTYARLFREELTAAWRYAKAIQGARQGEAPARAVPQFQMAA